MRHSHSHSLSRRELLTAFLGLPATAMLGCGDSSTLPAGQFVGPSFGLGHKLRDGFRPQPNGDAWQDVDTIIVGGGVAGLSAAWRLNRKGAKDFVVLEMESAAGGTSRSDESRPCGMPWGAHYIPTPMAHNSDLIALLDEMGVLDEQTPFDDTGNPNVAEQFLCRDPEERVFANGRWHEGLYLADGASDEDRAELAAFQREIDRWVKWRDAEGRRAFAIPMSAGSEDAEVQALDKLSMDEWMSQHDFNSPRLKWVVDYACRDDYGARPTDTSAWAGIFYFASRRQRARDESQPLIAWPEGNGRIVNHLLESVRDRVQLGMAATEIRVKGEGSDQFAEVVSVSLDDTDSVSAWRAKRVIFAAPTFMAPVLIRDFPAERTAAARQFEYGTWMVSNLWLRDRPREHNGFPLAWDNVLYDSTSLGYVVATHQRGLDHGPTIWTHYYPFCDEAVNKARAHVLDLEWSEWADVVLSDLEQAHPEIRSLVERLDVIRWGHAMIRPRPGFVWSEERLSASRPIGPIHFAHTDLSGIALFEEAFYHGLRAADETLARRNSIS